MQKTRNSSKCSPQVARNLLSLTANPQWEVFRTFLTERLEDCRDRLETAADHKFDQGRAAELRFILELRDMAEAIVKNEGKGKTDTSMY